MVRNLGELGLNLQQIVKRLLANQNLLKLLYYTDKDPLSHADITDDLKKDIFGQLITVVPRVSPNRDSKSIIAIRVLEGRVDTNEQFQNLTIQLEIFVPLTEWLIKNSNLRPFAILGEIQASLNNKNISGIGVLRSDGFELSYLTDEVSCHAITYDLINYE